MFIKKGAMFEFDARIALATFFVYFLGPIKLN